MWATARKPAEVAQLRAEGFVAVQLDVNDRLEVDQLSARIKQNGKGLDILINNAGYGAMGPVLDAGVEGIKLQFETNVFSVVSGVLVTPFAGAYCASKAAVHALSDALRMELAPFGIRVMEVQPGAIDTSFAKNASAQVEHLIAEDSPWWPMREGIRARAHASQDNPTPVSELTDAVFQATQKTKPPALLRHGNGSRAMPLLASLVPRALLQKILMKRFGLNTSL